MRIDRFPRFRRQPEMAATIAVQGAEQALALDHFLQGCHHGQGRLLFHQLGVVDLTAGIVENDQQVVPAIVVKPAMLTAIDVQQHARQGPPWSPLPVHPALAPTGNQSRPLQHPFDPAVAELDLMFGL